MFNSGYLRELKIVESFGLKFGRQIVPDGMFLIFNIEEEISPEERGELIVFTKGRFILSSDNPDVEDDEGIAGVAYSPRSYPPGKLTVTADGDSEFVCLTSLMNDGNYPVGCYKEVYQPGEEVTFNLNEKVFICCGKLKINSQVLFADESFIVSSSDVTANIYETTMVIRGL
jgi:hypothetical protein